MTSNKAVMNIYVLIVKIPALFIVCAMLNTSNRQHCQSLFFLSSKYNVITGCAVVCSKGKMSKEKYRKEFM